MKKIISFLLLIVFLFSFTSCGSKESSTTQKNIEKNDQKSEPREIIVEKVDDIRNIDDILHTLSDYYFSAKGVEVDESTYLVTNYANWDEFYSFISQYWADELIDEKYSPYTDSDASAGFSEEDGKLYYAPGDNESVNIDKENVELVGKYADGLVVLEGLINGYGNSFYCALKVSNGVGKLVNVINASYSNEDRAILNCLGYADAAMSGYRTYILYHNFFGYICDEPEGFYGENHVYTEMVWAKSVNQIESNMLLLFSKRLVDSTGWFKDDSYFTEIDGKVYCTENITHYDHNEWVEAEDMGYRVEENSIKIDSISEDANKIVATAPLEGTSEWWTCTFIYEDGRYKLDDVDWFVGDP